MTSVSPVTRYLFAGIAGFAGTAFVVGVWQASIHAKQQGWLGMGYGWLALDFWAHVNSVRIGIVGGAGAMLVACIIDALPDRSALVRRGRAWVGAVSLFPVWLFLLVLAYVIPPLAARTVRPRAPEGAPNVLFVLIDTWRADHAGFLGYERPVSPGLDRLVDEGAVFENVVAQSGWTKPTVATLLTGRIPSAHGAVSQSGGLSGVHGTRLAAAETSVIEVLGANGWDTAMWSNNPNILPHRGFAQGAQYFRSFVGEYVEPEAELTGTRELHARDLATDEGADAGRAEWMLPEVESWLAAREPSRPFCAYVHIMDPHFPYAAPEPFAGTFDQSGLEFQLDGPLIWEYLTGQRDVEEVTPAMLQRIIDIYDEELLYVDHYLTPFLERVRSEHPNTIIVLVGDHGEEFLEHGQFGHGHTIYEELVHVPLVLFGPGIPEGARIRSLVRQMDVFPTLLELTGTTNDSLGRVVHGESLVPLLEGGRDSRLAPIESGGHERPPWHWRGISDGEWKLVIRKKDLPSSKPIPALVERKDRGSRPWRWIFRLSEDPGEKRDLSEEEPQRLEELVDAFHENGWLISPLEILELQRSGASTKVNRDVLKDLGYAE